MQTQKFSHQTFFVSALALTWLGLSALNPGVSKAQESSITASVVGLTVNKNDDDDVYSGPNKVEVKLKFAGVAQRILKVEEDAAKPFSMTTNAGKVLKGENMNAGFMANIAEDGRSVTYPVSASELPPSGTTSLAIKGNVKLTIGDDLVTQDSKFEPKMDSKVTLGTVKTVIGNIEKSFDEKGLVIEFKSKKSFESIAEIEFVDENGKPVESSSAGSSSFSFGDSAENSSFYEVSGAPKSLTAKVKFYRSTKAVSVPVDVELDLGLGKAK